MELKIEHSAREIMRKAIFDLYNGYVQEVKRRMLAAEPVYMAVDADGSEYLFLGVPFRGYYTEHLGRWMSTENGFAILKQGSISKLLGRPMSWDDFYVPFVKEGMTEEELNEIESCFIKLDNRCIDSRNKEKK